MNSCLPGINRNVYRALSHLHSVDLLISGGVYNKYRTGVVCGYKNSLFKETRRGNGNPHRGFPESNRNFTNDLVRFRIYYRYAAGTRVGNKYSPVATPLRNSDAARSLSHHDTGHHLSCLPVYHRNIVRALICYVQGERTEIRLLTHNAE